MGTFFDDFYGLVLFCYLVCCNFAPEKGGTNPSFSGTSRRPRTEHLEGPWGYFSFFPLPFHLFGVAFFFPFFLLLFSFPPPFAGGVLALVFEAVLSLLAVQGSALSPRPGPGPWQRPTRGAAGPERPAPSSPHVRKVRARPPARRGGRGRRQQKERMERP